MNANQILPSRQEMEQAVLQRDDSFTGIFYFAVRSTQVFCRPGCPARRPRAENLEFFAHTQDAIAAGYRPCQRCRPLAADGKPPEWVARLLLAMAQEPALRLSDQDIREFGIDPVRVRRYFLKQYGMTFQEYARRQRLGLALEQLRSGTELDEVILGNGYESHSGFRQAFGLKFNQPPGQARQAECIYTTLIESPLGSLVAGASQDGICLLEFSDPARLEGQMTALKRLFGCPVLPGNLPHLEELRQELNEYFLGKRQVFTLPLLFPGSEFQSKVWSALQQIPYGKTCSYEDIAHQIGAPKAVRAVGTANGRNRIAIVIPCHRVVNKDGKLGGYGGGLWRKQWLLEMERRSSSD